MKIKIQNKKTATTKYAKKFRISKNKRDGNTTTLKWKKINDNNNSK